MMIAHIDVQESLKVAALTGAEPNTCWANAWDAMATLPGCFVGGLYVEGWMVIETDTEVHVIEHGWCYAPGGRVIDPTLIYLAGDWSSARYFAGFELSWQYMLANPDNCPLPIVRTLYRDNGMEHSAYRDAYVTACEYAKERSRDTQKRQVMYHMAIRLEPRLIHIETT